jgi:hypothetical protein
MELAAIWTKDEPARIRASLAFPNFGTGSALGQKFYDMWPETLERSTI